MDKKLTEIIFLLDRSGSMAGLESDTIGGFNAFIERQAKVEGETLVTTVLFDDEYELLWNGVTPEKAKLTENHYYVRGTTALLDAVGKTIIDVRHRLSNTKDTQKPSKVIFLITTDGLENASQEFSYEKIKELIERQQEEYNWEFIFMGANLDVAKEADQLGINVQNTFSFESSSQGVEGMYEQISEVVSLKRES